MFALAFVVAGHVVSGPGWRVAWFQVALALIVIALLNIAFLGEPIARAVTTESTSGCSLREAMRRSTLWVLAGATALFALASSGLGLFNEAVLVERGFDQKSFPTFLAVTTLFALIGQLTCGW